MRPSKGSPLTFSPSSAGEWHVAFTGTTETWAEPVIGWAVVVVNLFHSSEAEEFGDYDSSVQPVVLDDGLPTTMTDYLLSRSGGVEWSVERGPGDG